MRQITITLKQEGKSLLPVWPILGIEVKRASWKTKLADASQTSIATELKGLPAALLGGGIWIYRPRS